MRLLSLPAFVSAPLLAALAISAATANVAAFQGGDSLLRPPEKKVEKFDPSKVKYLTEWPKPMSKDQLATDIDRVIKAAIPEMAASGKEGVVAEGAAAVPSVLDRYGREKVEDAAARLRTILLEITVADQMRLLAKEFESKDLPHRTFALWRCAAFPDKEIKPQAEAAWAKVVKQGDKADSDERYAAALCATASGSMAPFDVIFEIAQKSWAKKGLELRVALESVRGAEATQKVVAKLGGERKAKIAALKMLAGCGDRTVLPTLKPLLDESDNEIRVVTINALRGIVDGDEPLEQLSSFEAIEMAKKWKTRI